MVEWQDIRGDCRDQDQRSEQVDNSYTQNATKVVSTGVRVVSPDEAGWLSSSICQCPDQTERGLCHQCGRQVSEGQLIVCRGGRPVRYYQGNARKCSI